MSDDPNTETEVGKRVRALREHRGWSISRLAQKSGVSPGYIAQIEAGRRPKIGATVLVALAGAFRVTVDELLGYNVSELPAEGSPLGPDHDRLARVESRLDTVGTTLDKLMELLAAGREARAEVHDAASESPSPLRAVNRRSSGDRRKRSK